MSDFYKDLYAGTGTLDGRTPDVGTAVLAPTIDLADGSYMQAVGDNLLTGLVVSGGAFQMDNTVCVSGQVIIEFPEPPTADYFVEIIVSATPTALSGVFISTIGRTSPEAANAPDGVNFVGAYYALGSDAVDVTEWTSLEGLSGYGSGGASDPDYPAGPYTIVLRTEFDGNTIRYKVDGTTIHTYTIVDTEYEVPGKVYVMIECGSFTADLSDISFLSIRLGDLPEVAGSFWTSFVKTNEVDA